MLNNDDIKLLNKILENIELKDEKEIKLKTRLSLIGEQIKIMELTQGEVAKIQEKIQNLDKKEDK